MFFRVKRFRLDQRKRHLLEDIVVLAICAVLGGADDWVSIEAFGKEKYQWFKQFLSLPNGFPYSRYFWPGVFLNFTRSISSLFHPLDSSSRY